ncbi:proline-, glutamic acid- and leucine-rich protein 1 [Tanacetum coccineum]
MAIKYTLIKTIATDACNGGWTKPTNDSNNTYSNSSSWADFQLASLRALLPSLLSPGHVRPPYLAHGLELFCKGLGSKLAEFCAHALMTLEKHNLVSAGTSRNGFENPESEEDDLYEKWVKDNDANEPLRKSNEDKGKGIMVETQSLEIISKQSEVISQTVDFRVSDKMETGDMGSKGNTLVSDFMYRLGDNDYPMDEIPSIVDVEPDSLDDE